MIFASKIQSLLNNNYNCKVNLSALNPVLPFFSKKMPISQRYGSVVLLFQLGASTFNRWRTSLVIIYYYEVKVCMLTEFYLIYK